MHRTSRRAHAVPAAVVAALALACAGGSGASAATDGAGTAASPADLGSEELPVHGTFRYHDNFLVENTEVVGAVHGVRRVDGGTAVYYSVGLPDGSKAPELTGMIAFEDSLPPYGIGEATSVRLVDAANLTAYSPLIGDVPFTTSHIRMKVPHGRLAAVFAVFPELPESTTTVDVQLEYGVTVTGVPVEDGPMEPAVDSEFTLLGEGWPEVPTAAEIATADPARVTFGMFSHVEDPTAATTETAEQVEVVLDANVLFAPDSAEVSADARARIEELAQEMAERGVGEATVTGHTDSVQGGVDNQALSEQRAGAVADLLAPALEGTGVTLAVAGRGAGEPVADNSTEQGRAENRRVTVVYQVGEDR